MVAIQLRHLDYSVRRADAVFDRKLAGPPRPRAPPAYWKKTLENPETQQKLAADVFRHVLLELNV